MPTVTALEVVCDDCAVPTGPDCSVTTAEGRRLCHDCAAPLPRCAHCSAPTDTGEPTVMSTTRCAECRVDWTRCDDCHAYTRYATAISGGGDVCDDCADNYPTCDDCDDRCASTVDVDGSAEVCQNCRDEEYHECGSCATYIRAFEDYCNSCHDTAADHDRIHSPLYKPEPIFHGTGPVFLGLELEIKVPPNTLDRAVETAIDHLDDLGYLKEDGSIRPTGFELVTHPMSYDYARTDFPWSLLARLRLLGATTDTSVGIHVHVSRAGFASPAHIYRWLKFIYRNERPVTALARRRSSQWADFTPEARARAARDARTVIGGNRYGHRYQAVNTLPAETFELRMFASSTNPQQVQAALAFADASVEYTRGLTAAQITRRNGWDWAAFAAWVATRPAYRPLHAEMEARACAS